MLAFQRLYLFSLVSGYATEESRRLFEVSPGGCLVLPTPFYTPLKFFHFSGYIFFS